ncbi:MAG: c-type cytochrome [Nitrospirae bacterium]|nr:c-type cytochrome [Nitrospirota bacterium]
MQTFIKISIFALIALSGYTLFANFAIPQVRPAPPPAEEETIGAMSMDQYIALGRKIFEGKGTCTLCHNPVLAGRAPNITQMHATSEQRLKDPRYKGKAKTGEEYLRESMMEPSAFVVAGFGKAGTNDTESPMPQISSGAIGLKPAEINAVIAYLQTKDGGKATVPLPTGVDAAPAPAAGAAEAPPAPAKTAEEALGKYACGACHKIGAFAGAVGPDLTKIGSKDEAYLRRAILDPNADIAKGFPAGVMPQDFGNKMTAKELEMLIKYLKAQKG